METEERNGAVRKGSELQNETQKQGKERGGWHMDLTKKNKRPCSRSLALSPSVFILCACMYICVPHTYLVPAEAKRLSDPLEHVAVSHCLGAAMNLGSLQE